MYEDRNEIKLQKSEEMIVLAVEMYEAIGMFVKLFDKLLRRERIDNYSIIVCESKFADFGEFLKKEKRRSDVLVSIEAKRGLYALICPQTEADGDYYFFKRLSDELYRAHSEEIRAAVLSVSAGLDDIWDCIIDIMDAYIELKFDDKIQDIVLKTRR